MVGIPGIGTLFSGLFGAGSVVFGQSLEKMFSVSHRAGTLLDESRDSLERLTRQFNDFASNLEVVDLSIRDYTEEVHSKLKDVKGFEDADKFLVGQFANKTTIALLRYWQWNEVLEKLEKNNPDLNIADIKTGKRDFVGLNLEGITQNAAQLSKLRMPEQEVEGVSNYLSNGGNLRMASALAGYYQDLSQSNNVILTTAIKVLGLQTKYNEIARVCDLAEPHSQSIGDQYKVLNIANLPNEFSAFKDKVEGMNDYQVAMLSYLVNDSPSAFQDAFGRPSNALNSNLNSTFMRSMGVRFSMQREMYEHIGTDVLDNWDKEGAVLAVQKNVPGQGEQPYKIKEWFSEYLTNVAQKEENEKAKEENRGAITIAKIVPKKEDITKVALLDLMLEMTQQDQQNRVPGREFDRIINANREAFKFLLVTRMDLNEKLNNLKDGAEIEQYYKDKKEFTNKGQNPPMFEFPQGHVTAGMFGLAALMKKGATFRSVAQDFGSVVKSRHNPDYYRVAKLKVEKQIPRVYHSHDSHKPSGYYNLIGLGGKSGPETDIKLGDLGGKLKEHFLSQPTVEVKESFRATADGALELSKGKVVKGFGDDMKNTAAAFAEVSEKLGIPLVGKLAKLIIGSPSESPKERYKITYKDTDGNKNLKVKKSFSNVVGTAVEIAASPLIGAWNLINRPINLMAGKKVMGNTYPLNRKVGNLLVYAATGLATYVGVGKFIQHKKTEAIELENKAWMKEHGGTDGEDTKQSGNDKKDDSKNYPKTKHNPYEYDSNKYNKWKDDSLYYEENGGKPSSMNEQKNIKIFDDKGKVYNFEKVGTDIILHSVATANQNQKTNLI